ncbi:YjbF family lipoprotein [uncultured Cedecea sp.]|uniref:YjbF family lipoprotein n=1 Tax=uncultured Cedecea sp. TaxID=988762 RepID=UPI00262E9DD7|nr:YjbF family lipoprotein [uncultured Cedecea sp.]
MRLFALPFFALLAGCTPSQQGVVDTFSAIWEAKDVTMTDEAIQSLPYASTYFSIDNEPRVFLVLGYIEQGSLKWLSRDGSIIVTRNGRLVKTANLHSRNLLEVISVTPDPLLEAQSLANGQTWSRTIRWKEGEQLRSAALTSRFTRAEKDEVLTIAGEAVPCQVWYEEVQSNVPDSRWQNIFWVDTRNGQVRQSHQMLGAGTYPVAMTILKPTL